MRCCNVCRSIQPLDKFGVSRASKDGVNPACKECVNAHSRKRFHENPERHRRYQRLWYDPFRQFVKMLKKRYGLTIEQFDEMMLNQGGMCAICDCEAKLVVDHDHATGKVRQLLCKSCNLALGGLKDSYDLVTKAAEYLKKHKTP